MCDVSFLTTIGIFFEAHRPIATGIYMTGAGVGGFVMPRVIRILIDEFGWRGALRVQSAISLGVVCLASLLLRHPRFPSDFDFKTVSTSAFHQHHRTFTELLKDRAIQIFMVASALFAFGFYLPFTYIVSCVMMQCKDAHECCRSILGRRRSD
jgi:predicted MFS family arabinose efflux permease